MLSNRASAFVPSRGIGLDHVFRSRTLPIERYVAESFQSPAIAEIDELILIRSEHADCRLIAYDFVMMFIYLFLPSSDAVDNRRWVFSGMYGRLDFFLAISDTFGRREEIRQSGPSPIKSVWPASIPVPREHRHNFRA